MSAISIRVAMWLFGLTAIVAFGALAYQAVFARGAASRQGEINNLSMQLTLLRATVETANAEALRKGQEAAQAAKATEDEQRRRIGDARAAAEAAAAARAADATEYERRLHSALAARAGARCQADRGAVPEAGGSERPAGTEANGVVFDGLAADLRAFAESADRINDAYIICRAAARARREVSAR